MQSLISKAHRDVQRQAVKSNKKNGVEQSDIKTIEETIVELKIMSKELQIEVEKDEGTYLEVAKSKVERRLKAGVTAQLASKHENTLEIIRQKLENKKEEIQNKIEKQELKKKTTLEDIDARIESLEQDIKRLREKKEAVSNEHDFKIEKLEKDYKLEETQTESSIKYFQPLIDRCYEEVPLDVSYPPSHYKKKEKLRDILQSIEAKEKHLLIMKAAEWENAPKADPVEEKLKILREQSRKEAKELAQEAERRERDQMLEEARQRKQMREAEEERAKERRANQKVIKLQNSVIQVHQECDSDYDYEGELLTQEQKDAIKLRIEEDWSQPLTWPPPTRRKYLIKAY